MGDRERQKAAKALCADCPVLDPCRELIDQLEAKEGRHWGIWAGETEHERSWRRRRALQVFPDFQDTGA
jgi:hypothetical protein